MTDEACRARVQFADRTQTGFCVTDLESLLPRDHPARSVWAYVEGLDLSPWYEAIRAVEGHAGRDAIDPRILTALWMYATLDGVGSARRLDALCDSHTVYQWIRGGVGVNYHTLSDFRTERVEALDELLSHSVAVLMEQGLVTLNTVAQDGKRVRASAGASSYRRRPSLKRRLQEAQAQVRALKQELEEDPSAATRRERAAQERAARERVERVKRAIERSKHLQNKAAGPKSKKAPEHVRVSTTDPEMPVMKMADGGFRPAVNVQFATDVDSGIIVGVSAVNTSDAEQLKPMHEQLFARYGKLPNNTLADGLYATRDAITTLAKKGVTVYAPVRTPKDPEKYSAHQRRWGDSDAYAEFRQRMETDEAKELYRKRASTAEWVNAQAANRGLSRITVRGLIKAKAIALWHALTHNLQRTITLHTDLAEVTV